MTTEGLPNVSQEFLQAGIVSKQIKKRKGGPHLKHKREKRRNEVFKLHFKYGNSAVSISQLLKANRNTINSDINYWYRKMQVQWENTDNESWLMKQVYRMEYQRSELMHDLEGATSTWERLAIRKIILAIDSKIAQITLKTKNAIEKGENSSLKMFNKFMDNHAKSGELPRFGLKQEIFQVSDKTRMKIDKLIDSDRLNHLGKW